MGVFEEGTRPHTSVHGVFGERWVSVTNLKLVISPEIDKLLKREVQVVYASPKAVLSTCCKSNDMNENSGVGMFAENNNNNSTKLHSINLFLFK